MKFTVPYITETTELYEVEARSANEATMIATTARLNGIGPTHSHVTKFKLGVVRTTLTDPSESVVAENPADDD